MKYRVIWEGRKRVKRILGGKIRKTSIFGGEKVGSAKGEDEVYEHGIKNASAATDAPILPIMIEGK